MMTSGPFTLSAWQHFLHVWLNGIPVCVCIFFISTFFLYPFMPCIVYTHTHVLHTHTSMCIYLNHHIFKSIHPPVNTWVVIVGSSIISCLAEDDLAGRAVRLSTETGYESHALSQKSNLMLISEPHLATCETGHLTRERQMRRGSLQYKWGQSWYWKHLYNSRITLLLTQTTSII